MPCLTQSLLASPDHPSPKYAPHIIPLKPQAKPAAIELPLMLSHILLWCLGLHALVNIFFTSVNLLMCLVNYINPQTSGHFVGVYVNVMTAALTGLY